MSCSMLMTRLVSSSPSVVSIRSDRWSDRWRWLVPCAVHSAPLTPKPMPCDRRSPVLWRAPGLTAADAHGQNSRAVYVMQQPRRSFRPVGRIDYVWGSHSAAPVLFITNDMAVRVYPD